MNSLHHAVYPVCIFNINIKASKQKDVVFCERILLPNA